MSNFLGSGDPKISFTWNSELKTFEPESHRIQFIPRLNIQEQRIHTSKLNGTVTKEHLGFYHEAELYYHSISAVEFEDILRYTEVVDSITLQPFDDNPDFIIEMLIEKAYAYEYQNFGEAETAFYLKLKSGLYSDLVPFIPTIVPGFLRESEWFTALEPNNGGFLREEILDVI